MKPISALAGAAVLFLFAALLGEIAYSIAGTQKMDRQLGETSAKMDIQTAHLVELSGRLTQLAGQFSEIQSGLGGLSETVRLSMPREIGHDHTDVRIFAIKSQLAQAENPIVIVGDSITESALLPSNVCGRPLINAGVGGADTNSYAAIVEGVFPTKPVPLIVVALGTNNSSRAATRHTFANAYISLLDRLAPHTAKLVLAGIPRIEKEGELAIRYFDSDSIDSHDAKIRDIAKDRALGFIDLRPDTETGVVTVDGVHLNADGYKPWTEAMLSGIASELGCGKGGIALR